MILQTHLSSLSGIIHWHFIYTYVLSKQMWDTVDNNGKTNAYSTELQINVNQFEEKNILESKKWIMGI